MRATAAVLALLAGLVFLQVQPCLAQTDATPDARELANGTVAKGKDLLGQVGDGVQGAKEGVGDAAGKGGNAFAGAASALGRFVGAVAAAIGTGALATWHGLAATGAAVATGTAQLATAVAEGAATALAALGQGIAVATTTAGAALGKGLAAIAGWVGAQLAALAAAYMSFVGSLRPRQMPQGVFNAVAATGTVASAGAAGYGLWALLKKFGWLVAPVAGFSRIANSELLEHPMRAQVFQVIQSNPGIHASELSRKVGAGWGTITHHLEKLEKARLVTTRRVNNQKCYFEDGGKVSSQDMAVASAVRGDSAGQIASFVASHPMTSQKAMAQQLGMSAALASFHVKKLVGVGVLEKIRRGKETLLTTTQAVRRVMTAPALEAPAPAVATVNA